MTNDCERHFFVLNHKLVNTAIFNQYFCAPQDYIYEVLRANNRIPLFVEDHLSRLFQTFQLSGSRVHFTSGQILADINKLLQANSADEGNLKISVLPGDNTLFDCFIYFTPHSYPTAEQFSEGVRVSLLASERYNPNAKIMNLSLRKESDLRKVDGEFYELLLVDHEGFITEGSRSNVFFIKNNKLITPPQNTVLPGVTRKQVLDICLRNHIGIEQKKVHVSELSDFDALFITGTSRRILPVRMIDNLHFVAGHHKTLQLAELLQKRIEMYFANYRH